KTAYTELTARFLSAKSVATRLSQDSSFNTRQATSSDENILTANASTTASVGSYSFQVQNLVSTNQLVSAGFASRDSAVGAGAVTVEMRQRNVGVTSMCSRLTCARA